VRDALERGAREGRARLDGARASLDGARASRRRHDALADLGELVLDLIRRGEIDLAELPEARSVVRELDELDERDEAEQLGAAAQPEPPRPAARRRFDDRPPQVAPPRRGAPVGGGTAAADAGNDGTVSSGAALRSARATLPERPRQGETPSTRAPTKPIKGMWRPHTDDMPLINDNRSRIERWDAQRTAPIGRAERAESSKPQPAEPSEPSRAESAATDADSRDSERDLPDQRPAVARDPSRKGGISFDDDDDLADYMHPDDVPPKPPAKDPDDRDP